MIADEAAVNEIIGDLEYENEEFRDKIKNLQEKLKQILKSIENKDKDFDVTIIKIAQEGLN